MVADAPGMRRLIRGRWVGSKRSVAGLRGSLHLYVHTETIIGGLAMATVVTINRPDVVALIERAAARLTGGNKTEAVALAVRRLLEADARAGSLFGAHRGSVQCAQGST
jgi:hypothetical protein